MATFLGGIIQDHFNWLWCSTAAPTNLGVVQKVATEFPSIRAQEFRDPIGKGGALIEGLKLAKQSDLIGYVDADGATPPRAFLDLVKQSGAADCIIGSRWLPGAQIHQSPGAAASSPAAAFTKSSRCCFG